MSKKIPVAITLSGVTMIAFGLIYSKVNTYAIEGFILLWIGIFLYMIGLLFYFTESMYGTVK